MVNKNLITGKKHEDRELAAKTCFETTPIEIETPRTMILLLESKEEMILLKALASLDKFAGKLCQNSKSLFEEGVLKPLIPLIDHSNLYIKRFSIKLLSELCQTREVVDHLLEEYDGLLLNIMKILNEASDSFIKEFSATVIAEFTKTQPGYDQFLETNMLNILVPLLTSNDPDIQYNVSKILLNLISEPNEKSKLTEDSSFTIKHFLNLVTSEYVAIQNITLDILYILTEQTKLNPIPKQFQDAGGVQKILAVIKNYDWKDIHGKALDVLGNIYNDPHIAQNFLKDGLMQLFTYIDYMSDPELLRRAIAVLAKITETPLGRKVFSDSGCIPRLEAMLGDHNDGVVAAACHTIANLAQDFSALRQLAALPTVEDLLKAVTDEGWPWDTRGEAIHALHEIMKRDSEACGLVTDRLVETEFIDIILNEFDEVTPLQAAITSVNCIATLAGYADLKEKIIKKSLISCLLHCFQEYEEDTAMLKLAACEALCGLLSDPQTRDLLHSLDGLSVIWPSVTKHPNNVQFLQSVATFVHLCIINDKRFTPSLLRLGVLNWLLSQRSLRNDCPAWEMALETVFCHFLPIKFAFTGRLEMTDITDDHFYITRVPLTREQLDNNCFPILDNLIESMTCSLWNIYLVNISEHEKVESVISPRPSILKKPQTDSQEKKRSSLNSIGKKKTISETSEKKKVSVSYVDQKKSPLGSMDEESQKSNSIYDEFRLSFISNRSKIFAPDAYLLKYIESLKEQFNQSGLTIEPTKRNQSALEEGVIREKTRLVAEFVAKQLSGMEPNEVCTTHMMDLHLNELMMELADSMIPLGYLRVGLHLERALLFKVLADQVGLPCSLVRGPGPRRRGWVEVCLPHLPPAPRPQYPHHLLRPSHVVDLVHNPGALLQLGTYEADVYCGLV